MNSKNTEIFDQETSIPVNVTDSMDDSVGDPKYYIDEWGEEWCACNYPKLIPNSGGRGQAKCSKCDRPWFH